MGPGRSESPGVPRQVDRLAVAVDEGCIPLMDYTRSGPFVGLAEAVAYRTLVVAPAGKPTPDRA